MPRFIAWQRQYGAGGLQIVGVSMDDDAAPGWPLSRRLKVNYPLIMGDARAWTFYGGILGLPVSYHH